MVERTPLFDVVSQVVLFLGLLTALAPFAIVAIAATHDIETVNLVPMPLVPGHHFLENLAEAWQRADLGHKLVNSILFAADYLPAGTYVLTYTLVPLQAGEYRVLPAHAWESFFPEVQGTSAGAIFEIKP